MSNGLTFEIRYIIQDLNRKWPLQLQFEENQFKIKGEIAENHAILVDHS